jgi:hypothetical protein
VEFRIADSFTDSLARLTGDEQKAVKMTAFDLQINAASPGMSFHKLDKVRDKNFWSVRVNADIRLIVHRSAASLLLCYVDHHDKAYAWAERRKLETHPKTGAAQLVEIRETVKEIVVPTYVQTELPLSSAATPEKPPLFAGREDDELLGYGVPPEWLADVRKATEDTLLVLADHLPAEAAEALLELATGGRPRVVVRGHVAASIGPSFPSANSTFAPPPGSLASFEMGNRDVEKEPLAELARLTASETLGRAAAAFEHPDAQRRFRLITSVEELQQALDFPWDKWSVFLHPAQRVLVERDYSGPARVSGSAGTGKTIVALHRAAYLARSNPDARVLLTTFSDTLAHALQTRLRRLIGNEPRLAERIDVGSIDGVAVRLYKALIGPVVVATADAVARLVKQSSERVSGHKFSQTFLVAEWENIVDSWQIDSWDGYREFVRLGRKTRLPEPQRKVLWAIFEGVRAGLRSGNMVTQAGVFAAVAGALGKQRRPVFDFAIIDEAQDLTPAALRFLATLGGQRPNALFFAGDIGQRIFQQPFAWKSVGVDIRGRSRSLRVNYRTSHQIRTEADKLLGPAVTDADGTTESRTDTVSVFNGAPPAIRRLPSEAEEATSVGRWIADLAKAGVAPHEVGVFVRSEGQLDRARGAAEQAGVPFKMLDEHVETTSGYASIGTMHLAKGLEFRAVVVMACDDEIIPLQERIETVGDDADLKEIYETERHLLYVACTRARDHLLVTGVDPASEFLDDMK